MWALIVSFCMVYFAFSALLVGLDQVTAKVEEHVRAREESRMMKAEQGADVVPAPSRGGRGDEAEPASKTEERGRRS
jgi:hypothetical protein